MKLPLSEIKTNCEKCSFAVFEGNKQTGCDAGRLEKFQTLGKTVGHAEDNKSWFLLKRFCNMYREEKISVNDAYEKIKCKFGIVIFDYENESLDIAIESCKNIDYDKSKIFVVVTSKHHKMFGKKFNQINELKSTGITASLIMSIDKNMDIPYIEHEAFSKLYGCSNLLKVNHNQEIPKDFFTKIDNSINKELEAVLMYEQNNVKCMPFWAVSNYYLDYNSYDLMSEDIQKQSIESSMYKKYEE